MVYFFHRRHMSMPQAFFAQRMLLYIRCADSFPSAVITSLAFRIALISVIRFRGNCRVFLAVIFFSEVRATRELTWSLCFFRQSVFLLCKWSMQQKRRSKPLHAPGRSVTITSYHVLRDKCDNLMLFCVSATYFSHVAFCISRFDRYPTP